MFDQLSDRLSQAFRKLSGGGVVSESHIDEAFKEIRRSLLEADVHFKVVKELCDQVKAKAVGQQVWKSLTPGQQVTKIFHDQLVEMLGGAEENPPKFAGAPPVVILVAGLQGSGKTTFCSKLALYIAKKQKRSVGLIPADCARPAAKDQLQRLAQRVGVPCFDSDLSTGAVAIAQAGLLWAKREILDVVILDTAGRQQVDQALMDELKQVARHVPTLDRYLVIDAMIGSQGLEVARVFHETFQESGGLTGLVLSKLDGDARGGVALSARAVTQVPLMFASVGEKPEDLEVFHAPRMASRVLGMGDVMTLVEKAQENISEAQAEKSMDRLMKGQFTMEDFLQQMQMIQKMGPLEGLLKMIPGMGQAMRQIPEGVDPEREMKRVKAMIQSMTVQERRDPSVLNGSRRARIAKGSGVSVAEINRFVKQFMQMQKMMKDLSRMGLKGMMGAFGGRGGGPFQRR